MKLRRMASIVGLIVVLLFSIFIGSAAVAHTPLKAETQGTIFRILIEVKVTDENSKRSVYLTAIDPKTIPGVSGYIRCNGQIGTYTYELILDRSEAGDKNSYYFSGNLSLKDHILSLDGLLPLPDETSGKQKVTVSSVHGKHSYLVMMVNTFLDEERFLSFFETKRRAYQTLGISLRDLSCSVKRW